MWALAREGRSIRILFVIGSLEVGGAEMHLAQVLPRLSAAGFEIAVLTLSGRGALAATLAASGITVFVAQESRAPGASATWVSRAFRLMRSAVAAARIFARWRPDVVHFFLPGAYLIGAPIALLISPAKRAMSRRSLNDYQSKRPIVAQLERALHARMHALLGNSRAVTAQLIDEGAPPDLVHLIRNGIDIARFDGCSADPASRDRLELLCVANLLPYKGHADLIDALALATKDIPDWRLRLVGRDDGIGSFLRDRAAAAGLAARIEFLGPRDDVPALMAASHLALLCSHEEGFPNAVIEAMAAGLPVVATAVGGIPEAVLQDRTGLLVPARDPKALAAAIVDLGCSPAKRAALGAAGAARARTEFSLDRCVAEYAKLYESLKPNGAASPGT